MKQAAMDEPVSPEVETVFTTGHSRYCAGMNTYRFVRRMMRDPVTVKEVNENNEYP